MDIEGTGALGVAVVGVLGTLLSALLTQRAADDGRRREQERAGAAAERQRREHELRACYVALNTTARQYLAALADQVHALGRNGDVPAARQRLAEARDRYRAVYAEAQLRVPEPVLDLAGPFSHGLGALYGMVRRLDAGTPRAGDSPAAAQQGIDTGWAGLRRVRDEMRAQLGVSRSDSGR
ncbi:MULTISPECIES: hypothetical protein [unclassified Kitasatospora]|uniref:hypothetical protein n=1 Tax=unclassified Kitasatospora TaxID=2633591 RepID=UPI0037F7BE84